MKPARRVCVIADYIDEQYAGIYTYAHELIKALLKIDSSYEYTFLHCRKNSFFDGQREIIVQLKRFVPGVPSFRKFVTIPHILRRERFDLVHDLSHIAPFAFARFPGKKVITIHDLTPVLFPKLHVWNSGLVHKIMLPHVFRKADAIIAVSENTKNDIVHTYHPQSPVFVTPLGTRDLASFASTDVENPIRGGNYILFLSTLEPRKNAVTLIEAYNLIRKQGRSEKLVLIGKTGWKSEAIFERIDQSPFRQDIILPGYLSPSEIVPYLRYASTFVYPSLYEGAGLPILEAMHFGVPVIAANNSSIPEIVGDAGLYFETTDPVDLASKLTRLLEDQVLQNSLRSQSLKQAQKFTWENTARKTMEVYDFLLP